MWEGVSSQLYKFEDSILISRFHFVHNYRYNLVACAKWYSWVLWGRRFTSSNLKTRLFYNNKLN